MREKIRNEELIVGQRITSVKNTRDSIIMEVGKARVCIYGCAYDEDDNEYNATMEIDIDPNREYKGGNDTFTDWVTTKRIT